MCFPSILIPIKGCDSIPRGTCPLRVREEGPSEEVREGNWELTL